MANLSDRVSAGTKWLVLAQIARTIVNILTLGILARFLDPEQFGQVALLLIVSQLAGVMADLGTKQALVQKRDIAPADYNSVFWFNIVSALAVTGLTVVFAQDIARLLGDAAIAEPLVWFSVIFLLSALRIVPLARLERSFAFGPIAIIETVSVGLGALAAMALALYGFGIGALLAQHLTMAAANAALVFAAGRWLPRAEVDLRRLAPLVSFGSKIALSGLVHFATTNLPRPVIAHQISAAAVGYLAIAQQIAQMPALALRNNAVRPLFPALSQVQHDPARLRSGYLRALHALAFATMPMCLGIAALADPIVRFVLGDGWEAVPALLVVLSIQMAFGAFATLNATVLTALRRGTLQLTLNVVGAVLRVAALLISAPFGLMAVVATLAAVELAFSAAVCAITLPLFGQRMGEALRAVAKPFCTSLAMGLIVHALSTYEFGSAALELLLLVPLGVALYIGMALAVDRDKALSYLAMLRSRS